MRNISITALYALKKVVDGEIKKRERITTGDHVVSDTVRISLKGTVKVCPDEEYTPTISIPHKTALALFLRYCGVTGEHALNALQRAMSDAIKLDKDAAKSLAEVAMLDEAEARVTAMLGSLPKDKRDGKVIAKVEGNGHMVVVEQEEHTFPVYIE
jgi:hypothetical protein